MSRLYLVKSRLQQACDAGVLAGRRVMTGVSVEGDANAMTQAQNFFNINLAQGAYGATIGPFTVNDVREGGVPTGAITGRVAGRATATVPMTLMRIFGNTATNMIANCEANLNISNNDIMFVLDLTGSMGCRPSGDNACFVTPTEVNGVWRVPESTGSKIAALRTAVTQFFATMVGATPDTARLRVAFMPYSSSANVAGILPANSLAQSHDYRSRAARMTLPEWRPTSTTYGLWGNEETYMVGANAGAINDANCTRYGNDASFTQDTVTFNGGNSNAAPSPILSDAPPGTAQYYRRTSWTGSGTGNGTCKRDRRTGTTTWERTNLFGFREFVYRADPYNVANATLRVADLTLNTLRSPIRTTSSGTWNEQQLATKQAAGSASGATLINKTWAGDCIEERQANDNIDLLATSDNTRWKPARRDLVYYPSNDVNDDFQPRQNANTYTCTMPAQRLRVMTQAQVDAYVANPRFAPHGATYHDIGMIWGTRLMSRNGVFAADHTAAAPNGQEVRRHIIFMTDGDMQPSLNAYTPYGIEELDRRISTAAVPTNDSLRTLHNQRFAAACNYARNTANISVWVVAFGQTLTPELTSCADPGQALQANNSTELNNMFQDIARRISELRLSQ